MAKQSNEGAETVTGTEAENTERRLNRVNLQPGDDPREYMSMDERFARVEKFVDRFEPLLERYFGHEIGPVEEPHPVPAATPVR